MKELYFRFRIYYNKKGYVFHYYSMKDNITDLNEKELKLLFKSIIKLSNINIEHFSSFYKLNDKENNLKGEGFVVNKESSIIKRYLSDQFIDEEYDFLVNAQSNQYSKDLKNIFDQSKIKEYELKIYYSLDLEKGKIKFGKGINILYNDINILFVFLSYLYILIHKEKNILHISFSFLLNKNDEEELYILSAFTYGMIDHISKIPDDELVEYLDWNVLMYNNILNDLKYQSKENGLNNFTGDYELINNNNLIN